MRSDPPRSARERPVPATTLPEMLKERRVETAEGPVWERIGIGALAAAAIATFVAFKLGLQPGGTASKASQDPSARSATTTVGCRDDAPNDFKSSRVATP